jgi:hypothetical protein
MATRRQNFKAPLSAMWKPGSSVSLFQVAKADLESLISASGKSDSELMRDVGAAWSELEKL